MKNNKLDSLLRDWAARHGGDPVRRDALVESVRRRLGHEEVSMAPVPAPARRKRLHGGLAYAVGGFAAGLLVAVGLFWTWPQWRGLIGADPYGQTAYLSAAEIKRSGELFRRMEEVFPGNLCWVAETGGEVSLGLGQCSGTSVSQATPLVVRTVVLKRVPGESAWRTVFAADVLSRGEEMVEIAPSQMPDDRLLVWAYRLPDGNVAVDANLRLADSPAAGVDVTNVLAPGRAVQVFTTKTPDAEFRVFQAASPLSS
jgi:hypothetical protein